jgi:DNA mismatch repair protein MutL
MSIRRLPEHLVNRIAAGEVVERPASALKELVEKRDRRRRDADRDFALGGGIERIEVSDDGCGMTPADMALALERHATSKLPDDAIEAVSTLGLRGEALPIDRQRRAADDRKPGAGRRRLARTIDNGQLTEEGPAALPPGTRIASKNSSPASPRAANSCARSARNMPPASTW